MNTYALINNSTNLVENTVLWNGVSYNPTTQTGWSPPANYTAIQITGMSPQPFTGWSYVSGVWTAPAPPPSPPDIQSFTIAILSSNTITTIEKGYLLGALAALKDEIEIGNNAVTEAGWQAIENSGDLSTTAINTILALAPKYNIPIS